MKIIEREKVYTEIIEVSNNDLQLAIQGRKSCTIRLGKVTLIGETFFLISGINRIEIKVIDVDVTRVFGSLNDKDAQLEGFQVKEQLIADLQQYYGKLEKLQPISIIYFKVAND